MNSLSDYFSQQHGDAFARALPALQQRVGCIPFGQRGRDFGVAGNTLRAYRGWPHPPSRVYREWAENVCADLNASLLGEQVATPKGFRGWHASLAKSLQLHWENQQANALSFAHQYKLIDLFVKWLSGYDFGSNQLTKALVLHGNCPLDSKSLAKLNECLSLALPIANPSMGDIHSEKTYEFCQGLIGSFAHHYGGTRLLFEYFAWPQGGEG